MNHSFTVADITFILKYDRLRLNGSAFSTYERIVLSLERSLMFASILKEKRTSLITEEIIKKLDFLNGLLQKDEVFKAYCVEDETKEK